jgi:hypothetical protein
MSCETFGLENTVDEDDHSISMRRTWRRTGYCVVMAESHDTRTCREYMGVRGHNSIREVLDVHAWCRRPGGVCWYCDLVR